MYHWLVLKLNRYLSLSNVLVGTVCVPIGSRNVNVANEALPQSATGLR